uniref:Uncharacterized protein n=1 Tax=Avena sativa TaxID=4498 RepID=A0ACD5YBI3_AVESA
MSQEPTARSYRRASQHAHRLHQEEMSRLGSDHDLELKSISFEPTTEQKQDQEQEQQEEEGGDDDDDDEEEEEDEEDEDADEDEEDEGEELAPESSMEKEKDDFALHRKAWEFSFKRGRLTFGTITSLSPMVYTHCTPSCLPGEADLARSLQMCSIKIARIKHLQWPLHVYGTVASRDCVDHKRNILFFRPKSESQTLTKKDPYLHLTGPRRGILSVDPVHIEVQLMLKKQGQCWAKDRELVTQLERSRQATVLAVRVMEGAPFKYGGQVLCCASPYDEEDPGRRIVLFDSKYGTTNDDGTMPMDPDGYLDLSRRVVSVQGRLKIFINTHSRSGSVLASGRVSFRAKDCQTSSSTCFLHNRRKASKAKDEVKITVAWSRFARQLADIEIDCFTNL